MAEWACLSYDLEMCYIIFGIIVNDRMLDIANDRMLDNLHSLCVPARTTCSSSASITRALVGRRHQNHSPSSGGRRRLHAGPARCNLA